jgi:uncharacterized protein (TIGR03000 family)
MMRSLLHSRRLLLVVLLALLAVPLAGAQAPDRADLRATITVRVHPKAKVTVDGAPTQQSGGVRRFSSPPLEKGKKYYYTFVAEWMPNNYETFTVTRRVPVEAGKTAVEDLTKADSKKGDKLFIRYVPTPPEIVEAMMKLAKVGKDDVVYDLGCGDGRLVITAVKQFHAKRGVGIDLDPERIKEAKENAKQAGVEKQVEFRQGDVLKPIEGLSDATVVTLYLSDALNEMLRPTLEKELKPGTRIVSHRFVMGDWKPEKTETHTIPLGWFSGPYRIHLWTIPKKDGEKKKEKDRPDK